jgi:hypothetical protein
MEVEISKYLHDARTCQPGNETRAAVVPRRWRSHSYCQRQHRPVCVGGFWWAAWFLRVRATQIGLKSVSPLRRRCVAIDTADIMEAEE